MVFIIYEICMTIGPATVMASVKPVVGEELARCRYVIPAKPWGTVQAPLVKGVKAAPLGCPPLTKAHEVAPVAVVVT